MTTISTWLRTVATIARRDIAIEWRSRVAIGQVLPFAAIVVLLNAFAIDDLSILPLVAPGLIWITAVLGVLLLVQRAFAIETEDGALDVLRNVGIPPSAIFWGKTVAIAAQTLVLVAVLVVAAIITYGVEPPLGGVVLLVTTIVSTVAGLAAVGTLYGGLAAGARGRETLFPLLLTPVVAPVLIGATRAIEPALGSEGTVSEGWPWLGLVALFTVAFGLAGTLAFGPLIDEEEIP